MALVALTGSPSILQPMLPIVLVVVEAALLSRLVQVVVVEVHLHRSLANPRSRAPTTTRAAVGVRGSARPVVPRRHASSVALMDILPLAATVASSTTFWASGMMAAATRNKRHSQHKGLLHPTLSIHQIGRAHV